MLNHQSIILMVYVLTCLGQPVGYFLPDENLEVKVTGTIQYY